MPNDCRISTFIANTYALIKDYTEAVKYYKKAMKQAPKDNEIKLIYLEMVTGFIQEKMKGRR